jgi:uncharacterized membrane protein
LTAAVFVPGRSEWLLFAHVAAAFVFFGAAITVTVASVAATRVRRAREVALLARLAHRVNTLLLWPALVILVGAGAQLASSEDAYGRGWLRFGMVLTGIVAVIGGGLEGWLNRRRLRVAERAAAEGLDSSPELERLNRSPALTMVGTLSLILLVIVFWLMTAKPGIYE